MKEEISEANLKFFQEVMPVIVGTKRRSGIVKMDPAWFEFREGYFWLNSFRGSRWLEHLEREGRASLLLIDPKDMTRVVHIESTLVRADEEGADEHLARLNDRYQMPEHDELELEPQTRVTIQLEPQNIRSTLDWLNQCAAEVDVSQ
ncbi:pyridoxamine 5'-phosphate oxidase family protein [Streptomyces sp. ST2-7A]|uniref:pyridoxamine 5'-phosphate oxidase family protein n=1 Tax=Streptomyces sp. ST2-7A TaxID=2907214 RepID=UPI001F418AB9|nr:pyridoxamine 5'-phosphate oxidase family protein [Streptomyces sp. ST2-7A]MCE7081100.1 pyridoxamine 5'-phosphate oxidase family protein [Streptomyces sp. ST2-7A]